MAAPVVPSKVFSTADLLEYARNEVLRFQELRHNSGGSSAEGADSFDSFNFGDKGLRSLPEELVDIIKDHTVRIALDRNLLTSLSGLGPRLGELTRLKYLVLRHNELEEFPTAVFDCPGLEYLDLRSNNIKVLPSDLNRLTSIKVISVKYNQIKRLPVCIGQMTSLQFMTTSKNPIEFPDKKEWKVDHRTSDKDPDDKRRLVEETTKLKKVLQKYAAMSPTQGSEFNDNTPEATRPVRGARGARFPIRPSVSSVNLDAPQASPQSRPSLASSSRTTPRLPTSATMSSARPSIDPLGTIDGDRNRSSSESHMNTKRNRRMGMQVSRGGKGSAELFDLDTVNGDADRQAHIRDISTSSFLSNAISADGTDSSPSPSTPLTFEPRESTTSRLSSLPENKRKSQYVDPFVEMAQGVAFAIEQVEIPVRAAVNAVKISSARQRDLERAAHSVFTSKQELNDMLTRLGIYDEGEEPEEHKVNGPSKPVGDIGAQCERCLNNFSRLVGSMSTHAVLIVEHTNGRYVRLLMHMIFASHIELGNTYKKFCSFAATFQQAPKPAPLQQPVDRKLSRVVSPSPRPTTSLRIKNPKDLHHGDVASYLAHKPLPSPRLRNGDRPPNRGSSRSSSRLGETRNVSVSTLSTSSSFLSPSSSQTETDDEERVFEDIYRKLNAMCDSAQIILPACSSLLQESRHRFPSIAATLPPGGRLETYDMLMHLASEELANARDLKSRLQILRIRESRSRDQSDFWQQCMALLRAHSDFAKSIQAQIPLLGLSDEIRNRMRPLHYNAKDVTHAINNSAWSQQARHTPVSATPLSASWSMSSAFSPVSAGTNSVYSPMSGPSSASTPRSKPRPSHNLTINSSISSMASQSGGNSGYTTPLPATPISAALGPAAQASVVDNNGNTSHSGHPANGFSHSPMMVGHDTSVASLSAMPGWYNQGPEGMSITASSALSHSFNQPSMNRSASSASIRSMGQRQPPLSSMSRSVSQRR